MKFELRISFSCVGKKRQKYDTTVIFLVFSTFRSKAKLKMLVQFASPYAGGPKRPLPPALAKLKILARKGVLRAIEGAK